jgi:hypothetical protein
LKHPVGCVRAESTQLPDCGPSEAHALRGRAWPSLPRTNLARRDGASLIRVQHRLRYALRGGEYAFAVPEGDLDALEEIAGQCCDFWNGANSLLIPVAEDGAITEVEGLFEIREPERIYMHGRVSEAGQAALRARWGEHVSPLWPEAFRHEHHPLNLQPSAREPAEDGPQIALPIPSYEEPDLARIARIVWGRINDDDRSEYEEAFLLESHDGDAAHYALLAGQITGLSPLAQSTHLMRLVFQSSPVRARQLFVIDKLEFDQLVLFWNVRARATTWIDEAAVVAIPATALDTWERLRPLLDWMKGRAVKPDLLVYAPPDLREGAGAALEQLGFTHAADQARLTEYLGQVPEERQQLEYAFSRLRLGGRMRRGLTNESLVTLEPGRNLVGFEPPEGFGTRWGGHVRLDLLSWPLPFPPTAATARRVQENAFVDQGVVCVVTAASNRALTFDLVLPGADDVLNDFLEARDLTARLSAAGRYAQALIGRLGGPQRLDSLARPGALAVLEPLTPLSRHKLLQRLDKMLTERYGEGAPPQEELVEMLRGLVTELDLPSRTLSDLASKTGAQRRELLTALEELIDVGFVRRGRQERCPECGYDDFYSLGEIDERVTCHACQTTFLLHVATGGSEPSLAYQLDPLMARAMDQNLLPVLLTLGYLYSPAVAGAVAFWPGIEIVDAGGGMQDCDIVLAQEESVIVCECKQTAEGLTLDQAERTLALAELFGAVTYFSALEGDFNDEIKELAAERGRTVLVTRGQLLPPPL